jgi:hypothetical protein
MDTVDTGIGEDRAAQLEVVEREPEARGVGEALDQ